MIEVEILLFLLFLIAVGFFTYIKVSGSVKNPDPISKLKEANEELSNLETNRKSRLKEIMDINGVKDEFYNRVEKQVEKKRRKQTEN
jgi:hypothetical protein